MSSNKWNRHLRFKIGMIVVLSIVLILQLWVFFRGSSQEEEAQETTTVETETTTVTPVASSELTPFDQENPLPDSESGSDNSTLPDMLVTTPYCNLHYPGEWSSSVRTDTEITTIGCIVTFYGTANNKEVRLFSVFFAESGENSFPVGSISLDGISVDVSVELSDFAPDDTWNTADADDISAMQEGVNYLINKLEENSAFTSITESQQENNEMTTEDAWIVIEAAYCDLNYPAQWKDAVRWDEMETEIGDIITFYGTVNAKESVLFSIYFAESSDESFPIGVLNANGIEMDVSMEIPDLPDNGGWSDTDRTLFYGLQETANDVIERLNDNPEFTPA